MSMLAAAAASNLRNRLFWRWQAWRLRGMAVQESPGSAGVFPNFAALDHRGHADAIGELAAAMTPVAANAPVLAAAEVQRRLAREMGKRACAVVLTAGKGAVGGYAWAAVMQSADALDALRGNLSLAGVSAEAWTALGRRLPERPLLVLHELGLDVRYRRGFAPLKQLLKPLCEFGLQNGARKAFWSAPRDGALHALSLASGARLVHDAGDFVFFLLDDLASIAHVLSTLPAGDISDRLARVGPPRRRQERLAALPADLAARARVAERLAAADADAEAASA
ncbi:hypothetical protein, partial [Tahibacter caeni]|uniref:hypothetical protein n=1 Tax=Tahibacter caeni TaxID=1453545 RepID=UPI002147D25E